MNSNAETLKAKLGSDYGKLYGSIGDELIGEAEFRQSRSEKAAQWLLDMLNAGKLTNEVIQKLCEMVDTAYDVYMMFAEDEVSGDDERLEYLSKELERGRVEGLKPWYCESHELNALSPVVILKGRENNFGFTSYSADMRREFCFDWFAGAPEGIDVDDYGKAVDEYILAFDAHDFSNVISDGKYVDFVGAIMFCCRTGIISPRSISLAYQIVSDDDINKVKELYENLGGDEWLRGTIGDTVTIERHKYEDANWRDYFRPFGKTVAEGLKKLADKCVDDESMDLEW